MVGKLKEYLKNNFSNGPKAKILMIVVFATIVLSVTFVNMKKTVTMKIDG